MESKIAEQEYFHDDSLSEPHFAEEATIASAKPVVPLQEIRSQANIRRRIAFALSILGSLILGALGGTFLYKQKYDKPVGEIVQTAVSGAGAFAREPTDAEVAAGAKGLTPENEPVVGDDEATADAPESKQPEREATRVEPVVPRRVAQRDDKDDDEDEEEAVREMQRAERKRLKRARREAEREARRQREERDDLLRIREIFEGSRRPQH